MYAGRPDADFPNAHRHGVTAYMLTVWDRTPPPNRRWKTPCSTRRTAQPNIIVAETADDIRQAKADGCKAAFVLAAQGGDSIGNRLHRIEAF